MRQRKRKEQRFGERGRRLRFISKNNRTAQHRTEQHSTARQYLLLLLVLLPVGEEETPVCGRSLAQLGPRRHSPRVASQAARYACASGGGMEAKNYKKWMTERGRYNYGRITVSPSLSAARDSYRPRQLASLLKDRGGKEGE